MIFLNLGSIRKNLALLVILTVLPAIAILLYSGMEQRSSTLERTKKDVLIITHTMAQIQEDLALSACAVLSTLALTNEVHNRDIDALNNIFKNILTSNPNYANITLVDLDGKVLASGVPYEDSYLADRKHFCDALKTKTFATGEYIVTRVGKNVPAFPFAYPVLDARGTPVAVLTAAIDLTLFSTLYNEAFLPQDSYIAITDHNGVRLFYYPEQESTNPIGQQIKNSTWEIAKHASQPGTIKAVGSDGKKRIFAFEQVSTHAGAETYMYVWAGVPEEFILTPANAIMHRNLLLMLLVTMGALFIAWGFGRNTLITPINRLIKITNELAEGNLQSRVAQSCNIDELEKLTNSFHAMAQSLYTSQGNLKSSEERFKKLSEVTFEGIVIHNDGIVLDTNDSMAALFGYTAEELIGQNAIGLLFPDESQQLLFTNFTASASSPCEIVARKKDGTLFPVEVESRDVNKGEEHFRVTAVRDITERKLAEKQRMELESQLRQKYKMEAIGVLAGGMAHNFNNNLSIVLGNIELLQMKQHFGGEDNECLSNAKTAVLRSRDLIKQILSYSRQNREEKIAIQPYNIINETIKLLHSTLPASINLQKQINDNERDISIHADPSQIQECLINLCNNAVHAMDEKGNITISLGKTTLQEHDIPAQYGATPGSFAIISVTDTGSGISPEVSDQMFDLFFTTKPVDEGTGVGLSTVQGIVTQHGGLIKVNSTVGIGTTFELYFPISPVDEATIATSNNVALPKGSERILFIEDDVMLANLGGQLLANMGYVVTTMTDSTKALELLTSNADNFDLVITDQTMPEITGKELIAQLKQIRADLPTILCTGYSSRINEETAAELGIGAFLMKPVELAKMLQTMRQVLDNEK